MAVENGLGVTGASDVRRPGVPVPELTVPEVQLPGIDGYKSKVAMVLSGGGDGIEGFDSFDGGYGEARDVTPEILSMKEQVEIQLKLEAQHGVNADMRKKAVEALRVIGQWALPEVSSAELGDLRNSLESFLTELNGSIGTVHQQSIPKDLDMAALGIEPRVSSLGLKADLEHAEKVYHFLFGALNDAKNKLGQVYEAENVVLRAGREVSGIPRELTLPEHQMINAAKHCLNQARFFIG